MCTMEALVIRLQPKINLSGIWEYFCCDGHEAEVPFVGEIVVNKCVSRCFMK
jgi:hypothetical protein